MELPEDVLALIRLYSKPRMRFYREYNAIMNELGLQEWREVQLKLCTDEADEVIQTLKVYKEIFLATKKFQNLAYRISQPELYAICMREYYRLLHKRNTIDRTLRVLLVGEEKVAAYERWARYEDHDGLE
jgi:hypothetical protein